MPLQRTFTGVKTLLLACGSAACLMLTACGGSAPEASFKLEPLRWVACSEPRLAGLECASLAVPKDHLRPSLGTFELALVRAKATGSAAERIGSLFFNPGGPGVSGVDVVPEVLPALNPELRARFDFVSWDPRGVGRSAGLSECQGGSYRLPSTGAVDWSATAEQMRSSARQANLACAARYPDVVPYIGTNATARDLDLLRQAVNDEQLTFWGTSYGTRIGFVYAYHYPDKVRAMLLSSPVEPNATWQSFMLGSATSPDKAVGFFFEAYPLAMQRFDRVIKALSSQALRLPSGALVSHWDVRALLAGLMKSEAAFGNAADLLSMLDAATLGSEPARSQALATLDTMSWLDSYPVNGGATAFIGCLDYPQRLTSSEQDQLAAQIRSQAPIFGFGVSQGLFYCEGIEVTPDPVPVNFRNTQTPMLVIGSTHDALTQYAWAGELARNFSNSRVITYVGTQHTPYVGAGSACVDAYGTDYLVRLQRPAADQSCPNARLSH